MPLRNPPFWQKKSGVSTALTPIASLYQLGYRTRRAFTTPVPLKAKLLCVGNLLAGGAGKTPVALDIGAYLKAQGVKACYLSKGYGGSIAVPTWVDANTHTAHEVGDEPLLLARTLPTLIARDRVKGAKAAEAAGYDVIIADDGFQNPNLKPDIALVVVDAAYGFGNGRTLPAGPLREPVKYGLARATALVVLRRDRKQNNEMEQQNLPCIVADLRTSSPEEAQNRKLVAFSGIARPQQFFESLIHHCGLHIVHSHEYPDHHPFSSRDIATLRAEAAKHDASLITTAKDAVRLPADMRNEVLVAQATLNWHNAADMHKVLAPLLETRPNQEKAS
jgi:tetraacyldisaccharide 4'-kinase